MLNKTKLSILVVSFVLLLSLTCVSANESNTFTDLQTAIDESGNELNINHNYVYNDTADGKYSEGITINNRELVINGNGYAVDGSNHARILLVTQCNLTINNLILTDGLSSYGSGIYAKDSNIILNNVTFKNMNSTQAGSCLISGGSLTIEDSSFINTTSEKGSAVFGAYGDIKISNSEIRTSHSDWGAVYLIGANANIANTDFVNLNSNYASAVYATGSKVMIDKSKFTNLKSNKTAGAIGSKESKEVIIKNSEFKNISCEKNGGSLYFDLVENVEISNSTFTHSYAEFGGAILQLEGGLTVENCNFTQNTAFYDGGAIYASYVNLKLNNNNFADNRGLNDDARGSNGGGLYLDMTNATITNSSFTNNFAAFDGGAIYTYDTSLFMNKNYFTNNSQFNTTGIFSAFDKNYTALNCNFTDDIISLNNTIYATIVDGSGITLTLVNNTITLTKLPSRFDLRDFGWVSSVKNQGAIGACWTFGTCGSLESALLKATDTEYDFSENNVQNSMIKYSLYGHTIENEGGTEFMGAGYLLSWLGMFPTKYDTYDELGKISSLISTDEDIHIQDMIFVHPRINSTDNNQLKDALIKYGGLWVAYNAQQQAPYYNSKTSAQYYNGTEDANHAVLLVGWDDNYSKDNFLITPPGDGAFILKNSWGSNFGDGGYLYISYYDTQFVTGYQAIGVIINNTVSYNKNYQIDISGMDKYKNFNLSHIYYANEFEALENDLIAAVGTYFNNSGEKYEISIYVNDILKHTQSGISAFSGFSTIKLNNYIPVNKGDLFRAVIKGVNVPLSINTRVHNDGYTSFISADGKIWNTSENIICLKVYTIANSIQSSDLVKYYKNASKFSANVNAANVNVTFNINGVNYTKTSDENGTAYLNINLRPGTYNITTYFNGINKTNTVTVLSAIIGDNLVKYYKNGTEFYARFVKGNGEALANRNVTFNINGVFYTLETDSNGVAKLNINLRPGNYILTATDPETGLDIGFNITVLPTIIAENLTTYLNASQFNASFVKGNGDSLANVNVTFNINGVFYTRQTNNDGLATLNINLMPGKYIITAIEPVTGLDMGYGVTVLK